MCTSLAATAILATMYKQPAILLLQEEEFFYLTNVTFQKIGTSMLTKQYYIV